jgi:hypothetical protein
MTNLVHLDDAQSIFFLRELEQIKARTFEVEYAPLASTRLIPIDSSTSPGAMTVTYSQYDSTGIAKIISNYADDLPTADARGRQYTSNLKSIGNSFIISIDDIRAAQFAGKPLEQRKANAALLAHLQLMNKLAFFGDATAGITGWLTNGTISNAFVAGGDVNARLWVNKTPIEILFDLNDAISFIIDSTNGVEQPNVIAIPITQYQYISSTPFSNVSDVTILDFFLRTNPGVTVEWANELKGAFTGGTDGLIAYDRSINKFWQEIPQVFEMFPPQWHALAYSIPCHSKHGGTIVAYPQSQVFRRGI